MYLSNILAHNGLSGSLVTTWLFRSVFSVFVHIFCGMIVATGFSRGYIAEKTVSFFRYARLFFTGFLVSILIHALYDVSLTLGFTAIIFIYLAIGYLYCTGVFHREQNA